MTNKDYVIMTFTCLVLGSTFTLCDSPGIGLIIFGIGIVFNIWWIILRFKDKDNNWRGGPPSAA